MSALLQVSIFCDGKCRKFGMASAPLKSEPERGAQELLMRQYLVNRQGWVSDFRGDYCSICREDRKGRMSETRPVEVAPPGIKDHDPAPPCPACSGERYWSDYWTDEFVAICVPCIARDRTRRAPATEAVRPEAVPRYDQADPQSGVDVAALRRMAYAGDIRCVTPAVVIELVNRLEAACSAASQNGDDLAREAVRR